MAVIKVKMLDVNGGYNESGATYTIRYYVETDSFLDGPKTIRQALPFYYGDTYAMGDETDETVIATDIDVSQADEANPYSYFAEVSFSVTEPQSPDNPLLAAVEESYGFASRSVPVAVDLDDNPYMNTAGELIEHTRPTNYRTMTFVRNEVSVNNALVETVKDAINSTPWKGYAAYCVKVSSITHEGVRSSKIIGGKYYRVTYNFEVDYQTWRFRPLNAGINHIAPAEIGAFRLQPIMIGGYPVDRPVPLDVNGLSLRNSAGALIGIPYLLEFRDFLEVEFNSLFSGL